MFWADRLAEEITKRFGGSAEPLVIRDEKTPSGRVHIGSMRGVAIHGVVSEVLTEKGVQNKFLYEFNDMDPMDGFPEYLPESFKRYMGMPLRSVPSPDGKAENFAEYFASEFKEVIMAAGFSPEFYNVSELYLAGKMDDAIRTALTHAADIRRIYKEVSGSVKADDWYPLQVICEKCGKVGTTKVTGFDGEKVSYTCEPTLVKWAAGCGHEGSVSPFGGKAKFPFKVEWPAKWKVVGVKVEGAGKDHSTKGGARDVAAHIATEVFKYEAPLDAPYEFFLVGGKKMSSSKGRGSSAKEIAELVPAKILRLALMSKEINQAFNFDPEGDTIPVLYDLYDKLAAGYWSGVKDDYARLYEYIHVDRKTPSQSELPRFSQVAFAVQMPHLDIKKEFPNANEAELEERASYAKKWLDAYAPEKYVFKLQEELPEGVTQFTGAQKAALGALATYVESQEALTDMALREEFKKITASAGIEGLQFYQAIYISFLGKENGPPLSKFLSVLNKQLVLERLKAVSK